VAAQFGQTSDRVSRTDASIPNPTTGLTVLGWARVDIDTNTFAALARIWTSGLATVVTFATSNDGTGGPNYFTGGGSVSSSTGLAVGEWRRVGFSCLGTTAKVYAATPTGSVEVDSGTVSVNTPGGITLGGRDISDANENLLGTLAYWRVFAGELTQAQFEAEWASPTAVLAAWADWPLIDNLNDISGNNRHLSAGATAVDWVSGPELPGTAELAGTLPKATIAAEATVSATAGLAGSLSKATADLLATDQPVATAVLNGTLPKITGGTGVTVSTELRMQRRNTQAFIEASPMDIVLIPQTEQRTASGAVALVDGSPKPTQRFRLIPMSHTERPATSTSGAGAGSGGVQRKYDLTLLGNWDALIYPNDYWVDANGQKYVVDAVIPYNGYEVKGLVMSYGRRGSIV
jgi:hypothetical protein